MVQRQKQAKRPQPQPQHKKSKPSQHDKRRRLEQPSSERRGTTRAEVLLVGAWAAAVGRLAQVLDRRLAFRLAIIVAGMVLADGEFLGRRRWRVRCKAVSRPRR